MDILSRLSELFESDFNDLIDRAEDPEKMVRQIIADMQEELNKAMQNYSKIRSTQIVTEKKYKDAVKNSQDYENKAKNALIKGDRELAKQFLVKKVKNDEEVELYKEMFDSVSEQTDSMKSQVESLRLKLEDAKSRQAVLIARAKMADTKKKISELSGNLDSVSAFEKFSRMEDAVSRLEAEATAMNEISNTDESTENSGKSAADLKADAELERLVSEMNTDDNKPE